MSTNTGNIATALLLLTGLAGLGHGSRAGIQSGDARELVGIDTATTDLLGTSVAISGDVAVIGSPFADPAGLVSAGAAYVFQRNEGGENAWAQRKKLLSSTPLAGDQFGAAVAVDRDVIVVGSQYADVGGRVNQGLITVFQRNAGGVNQWGEVAQFTAGDGAAGDVFGISVAVDGPVMVVGAMIHDTSGVNSSGAAYVFERRTTGALNEWFAVGKLTAPIPSPIAYFGASVDVEGDVIAVGAPGYSGGVSGIGQTHIFERNASSSNTWAHVAVLQASDAAPGATFGQAVALENGVLVVGAPGPATSPATNTGAAYCFARTHAGSNQWQQMAKLLPSDPTPGQDFARTVEICGDLAIIGASRVNHVYLFQRDAGGENAWGEVARINAPAGVGSIDRFGVDVAAGPGHLLVGAPGAGPANGGAAYLYPLVPEDWVWYGNRAHNNRVAGDEFGTAVDMDGSVMIVGAPNRDLNGTNEVGAAYIFERGTNDQVRRLLSSSPGEDELAGFAVAVDGDVAVVGIPWADSYAVNAGEARVYHRNQGGSNNWGQVRNSSALAPFTPPPGPNEFIGQSVAISGDTILVGRPGRDGNTGMVDFFARYRGGTNEWDLITSTYGSSQSVNRYFGASVAIDGDTAIIGAHGDNFSSGAVHILQRQDVFPTPWIELKRIPSPDAQLNDAFGRNVDLSGDTALVSCYSLGKAYVFERDHGGEDNWGQAAVLIPTSTAEVVFSGVNTVRLDGDIAVLGDPFADVGGVDSAGAAWIFARNAGGSNAWGQVAVVRSDAPSALARFGYSVAVDGQALLVGAPTDDPGGLVDAGRATVFTGFLYGPPRISSITQTGNVFSVTFPSQPAWNYELEGSLNLTGGAWLGIPGLSGLPGETDGTTTITHTNVFGGTAYRIQRSEH